MSDKNVRELVEFCELMNLALNDEEAEHGVMETIHDYEWVLKNAAKILGVADSQPQDPLAFMPPLKWVVDEAGWVAESPLGKYKIESNFISWPMRITGPTFEMRTALMGINPGDTMRETADGVTAHYNAIRDAVREGRLLWLDADGAYTPADGLPPIPTVEMFSPLEWADLTVGNGAVVRGVAAETPLGTYRVQDVGGGDLMAFGATLVHALPVQSLDEGRRLVEAHYRQTKSDVKAGYRAFLIGKDGVWREGDAFLEPPNPAPAPMVVDTAVSKVTDWLDEAQKNYAVAEDVSDEKETQLALSQAQTSALISIAQSLASLATRQPEEVTQIGSEFDFAVRLYGGGTS